MVRILVVVGLGLLAAEGKAKESIGRLSTLRGLASLVSYCVKD